MCVHQPSFLVIWSTVVGFTLCDACMDFETLLFISLIERRR